MRIGASRIVRFPSARPAVALAARAAAIVLALVTAGVGLALTGASPFKLAQEVLASTFGSGFGLEDVGLLITPLILTGLAVSIALRVGAWNIGAEGQFYAGALAAAGVGLFIAGPLVVMLPLMLVAGLVGGALWILVPTLARAYADVSELITTLLLNFVATLLVSWLATGPWLDPGGRALGTTARIPYEMPLFWGSVHWGFPIAVVLTLIVAGVLTYTRWGYEVRITGSNPQAARYAGLSSRGLVIAVMLASGAIAGIAGALEVAGTVHRLQAGISNNFGYLGIMVAVLARGSALGIFLGAALMAIILNSGIILQTQGVTVSTVLAITGLILFFTPIGDELAHYRRIKA
jgi:simple sugar transport system permease protein